MKAEVNLIKHIDNTRVALELMKATNDISQTGKDMVELGLNGLLELINQFKKEVLTDFFKWINTYEELEYTKKGITFYVDEFFKINTK